MERRRTLLELPAELLFHLVDFLSPLDKIILCATSKQFLSFIEQPNKLKFRESIVECGRSGYVGLLDWFRVEFNRLVSTTALTLAAIEYDRIPILEYVSTNYSESQKEKRYWDLKSPPDLKSLKARWRDRPVVFSTELLVVSAYSYGSLETINWIKNYVGMDNPYLRAINPYITALAVRNGRPDVVESMIGGGLSFERINIAPACKHGNLKLLNTLKSNGCVLDSTCWLKAIKSGRTEVFDWLISQNCTFTLDKSLLVKGTCWLAQEDVAKHLMKLGLWEKAKESFEICAERRHWRLFELILEKGYADDSYSESIYTSIIQFGNLRTPEYNIYDSTAKFIPWLLGFLQKIRKEYKWSFSRWISRWAIIYNKFEILEWLHDENCPIDFGNSMRTAAQSGSVEIMEFLLGLGCPLDPLNSMNAAADAGHLEALKFLAYHGCEWNERVLFHAVKNGRKAIVKYYLENNFPLGESSRALLRSYDYESQA